MRKTKQNAMIPTRPDRCVCLPPYKQIHKYPSQYRGDLKENKAACLTALIDMGKCKSHQKSNRSLKSRGLEKTPGTPL